MKLTIPNIPPSLNSSLTIARGRLIHTKQARDYRSQATISFHEALEHIKNTDPLFFQQIEEMVGSELSCSINFYSKNWYYKNGNTNKKDLSNMVKLLEDSLFDALRLYAPSLDDCQIFEHHEKKIQGILDEDMTTITLTVMDLNG